MAKGKIMKTQELVNQLASQVIAHINERDNGQKWDGEIIDNTTRTKTEKAKGKKKEAPALEKLSPELKALMEKNAEINLEITDLIKADQLKEANFKAEAQKELIDAMELDLENRLKRDSELKEFEAEASNNRIAIKALREKIAFFNGGKLWN